jgi:hypothetical protein
VLGSKWRSRTTQSCNVQNEGFRVFIAERGTYGFFTDTEGSAVVSFELDLLSLKFSGNYGPASREAGTGWRIDTDVHPYPSKDMLQAYLDQMPPRWATGETKVTKRNLEQHLATYDKSSHYEEFEPVVTAEEVSVD